MIPKSIFKCSRGLFFENENSAAYPYQTCGTCFLVKFNAEYYIVTANHNIKEREPDIVRVFAHDQDSREFLPINNEIKIDDAIQRDKFDLIIYRIEDMLEDESWKKDAININEDFISKGRKALSKNSIITVSGYPGERRGIDYDKMLLYQQRVYLSFNYYQKSNNFMHEVRIIDRASIKRFNGFSGSPAFGEYSSNGFGLSGITLTGGNTGVRIIDSAILWNMLKRIK